MADKAFYDNDEVHNTYLAHRRSQDNPNDAIEHPLFMPLVGDLAGLDIIDLGCGDARFGHEALMMGARSYYGVEVSKSMATLARYTLEGTSGVIEQLAIEKWQAQSASADLVTSRLALNYVEKLAPVFKEAHKALRPGGRVVITVEHPIITSNFESLKAGRRSSWLVDNYFRTGARPHLWMGHEVVKYHRTLNDYFDLLSESGFVLEKVRESEPMRENFRSDEEYERRLRIPLFLSLAARYS
jgi:SAM-dependent methyltransferase